MPALQFFERAEFVLHSFSTENLLTLARRRVKDVLSYLQLIDCPTYTPAFARVVNTPKRGIGEKTVRDILAVAKLKSLTAFEVCVRIANGGGMTGVTTAQRKGLKQFVKLVLDLRKEAEEVR